jgi:hypothetical protein
MASTPTQSTEPEDAQKQARIQQSLHFWARSFMFFCLMAIAYCTLILWARQHGLDSQPPVPHSDYAEASANAPVQQGPGNLYWFLFERSLLTGQENQEGISYPKGLRGPREKSFQHYVYPTPAAILATLAIGWFVASFVIVSVKLRPDPPLQVHFSGPGCVSCRKEIVVGTDICPHCGWKQPY